MPGETSPFVAKACDVVINTNYDTVGTLTRATLDTLTPAILKTLFQRDAAPTKWVDTAPWFKTAFEMSACGIKRNGLHDWIFGNAKGMGRLVNIVKMDKSPSLVQPFILARQLSVINKEHWIIVGAVTKATAATHGSASTDADNFALTPLTDAQIDAHSDGTAVIRIKTNGGFTLDAAWFLGGTGANGKQGDRVNTFTRVSGAAKMGQYVVLASAASADGTFIDLYVAEENAGGAYEQDMPSSEGAAQDFAGVLLAGANNVNDFESWCQNRPTLNPEKRVPFFFQTSRRTRRIDGIYKETFAKLMRDNQYFAEFIDLPLAEKNKQDEEEWMRRKVNSFFFNKPISANQTMALYTSLDSVLTATPTITGAGAASVQGKFVTYRANYEGVYSQLRNCGRVYDVGNNPINLKELFDEIYNVYRSRKSRGREAMDIDIYTDNKTAEAFDRAMIRFYKDRSQDTMRMVQEITNNDPKKALGFYWRSYILPYPAGVKLHIITHETFDDWKNAFVTPDIETRGNVFLILDLGKGGIYPGMIASNRKSRTLGELENLAKIDPTYFCVLEHYTEEVNITSETMTVVVECPSDNLWIENFDGFQVNTPLAHYGTTTDLIGSSGTAADWYH